MTKVYTITTSNNDFKTFNDQIAITIVEVLKSERIPFTWSIEENNKIISRNAYTPINENYCDRIKNYLKREKKWEQKKKI